MIKNLIVSFFAKSAVAFTLLAILLVQSRQLGGEEVGQVSLLVLNLAIIQTISDIYTGSALVYFIAKYALAKIYIKGILWTIACIVSINLIFYAFHVGMQELWIHVLILSFISTLQAFHGVILLAKEKIKTYNFLIFFQPLLLLAILCVNVFLLDIKNVCAYIIAAYVSWSVSLLISCYFVIKTISNDDKTKAEVKTKDILRNGLVNQLGNLAHTLSNRYNYYMIATAMLVGVYASATSLIESVWILSGSISPIILTHIANRKDSINNGRVTFLLSKISFLLSSLCIIVVLFLPEVFFTSFLGKDFSGTKTIMLYLSPGVLFLSFSSIISHYYSGLGRQKILLIANSCGLVVTLCTSYYFISHFGLIGACYAASLSYLAQAAVLTFVFMKQNEFKIVNLFQLRKDLDLLVTNNKSS
ncbi:lipopolysaccharide biosynthesis protein [Aurantibacillus circumpalustris]|uniref:lipopolysaccharide biosynthesis protein n=1 Tax=Aurantibacillus circumpalustris TaxID=3036359 RepID=UPI00295BC9DC|nr:polysaccharide biosynthesis C-terminal domain-containing protein [Aurantibacillus circumpalustris]